MVRFFSVGEKYVVCFCIDNIFGLGDGGSFL